MTRQKHKQVAAIGRTHTNCIKTTFDNVNFHLNNVLEFSISKNRVDRNSPVALTTVMK
jgi:hypothetical protein